MTPAEYSERVVDCGGWEVRLTTYRLGGTWYTKADNVSPGAWLARVNAGTRQEAEEKALNKARQLLERTRRNPV